MKIRNQPGNIYNKGTADYEKKNPEILSVYTVPVLPSPRRL